MHTLCGNEWLELLFLIVAFVFVPMALFTSKRRMEAAAKFDKDYTAWLQSKASCVPARAVYGVVWGILYGFIVAAIFMYKKNESICTSDPKNNESLQLATWLLILANTVLNFSWISLQAISNSKWTGLARFLGFLTTLFVALSAIAIAILLFYQTAAQSLNGIVYVSAAFYAVYALWALFASTLDWRFWMFVARKGTYKSI